ncbi:MAG: hypothetical protein ACP5JJ_19085, partial [Anaerolineae bacterium]
AEAIDCLEQIVAVREDYQDAAQLLAEARQEAGLLYMSRRAQPVLEVERWTEAAEQYEALATTRPDQRQAHGCLAEAQRQRQIAHAYAEGRAKLRAQEWLDAIVCFKQVLALDPSNEEVPALLEQATMQRKLELRHGPANQNTTPSRQDRQPAPERMPPQIPQGALGAEAQGPQARDEFAAVVAAFQRILEREPDSQDVPSHLRKVIAFIE